MEESLSITGDLVNSQLCLRWDKNTIVMSSFDCVVTNIDGRFEVDLSLGIAELSAKPNGETLKNYLFSGNGAGDLVTLAFSPKDTLETFGCIPCYVTMIENQRLFHKLAIKLCAVESFECESIDKWLTTPEETPSEQTPPTDTTGYSYRYLSLD